MTDKERVLTVVIMMLSVIKWIPNKTNRVAAFEDNLHKILKQRYLMRTGELRKEVVGRYIKEIPVKKERPEYTKVNDLVKDKWGTVAKESTDDETPIYTSLLIQMLWDRIGDNPHKYMFFKDNKIQGVIDSIESTRDTEGHNQEKAIAKSKSYANRFLELCGIKPRHNLATRLAIQKSNLICEGRM